MSLFMSLSCQAYFKNISVSGFRTGIALGGSLMTVALDGVGISEAEVGLNITDKMAQIRGLTTSESVSLPVSLHGTASVVLIDSMLKLNTHTPAGPAAAIDNRNATQLYVRNVSVSPDATAIATPEAAKDIAGPHVLEYSQSAPMSAFVDAARTSPFLGIPIPTTPVTPEVVDTTEWTVFDTSACGVHNGTEILQAVIDSGVKCLAAQ